MDQIGTLHRVSSKILCPIFGITFISNFNLLSRIYMTELFLKWIKSKGGLKEMDRRSQVKSKLIYDVIDNSNGFYYNAIDKNSRSRVVIPFRIGGTSGDDALEKKFLEQAKAELACWWH